MKQYQFSRQDRLRKKAEFDRVYALRQRTGDQHLLIFAARNECGRTRIGLSVSRKHGGAVRRNRLKRLLREAFRLSQHEIPPGLDLILIPKQQSVAGLEDFQRSLVRLVKKLVRRLETRD